MAISAKLHTGHIVGLGTTAQALETGAHPAVAEVIVQSDPANTTNMLIGNSTAQYVVLEPGQSCTVPCFSLTLIYVKMASGTGTVNWLARI